MAAKKFIISYGHRNTDGGGAAREAEWTPIAGKKLQAAIIRRGGLADIVHEHDGDTNPTFSVGRGLQQVAARCVELSRTRGPYEAYLSMHYGAEPVRGFFAIPPGSEGLRPFTAADVSSNNPLDYRLAAVMAQHVAKTGMPSRGNGVLPESRTGVGIGGWRLGELHGTVGFRDRTARLIIEGGNYLNLADREMLWSPSWQDRYCEALVDALEEVFGKLGTSPTPLPPPPPQPNTPVLHRFDAPRTFTVNGAATVRQWASRDSEILMTLPNGRQFESVGYYNGDEVAGDKRWLVMQNRPWGRIHASGVREKI